MTADISVAPMEMRRLHPLTPVFKSWRAVGGAAAIGVGVFRDDLDRFLWIWHALHGDVEVSRLTQGVLVLLGVALVSIAAGWLSWRMTGFAIVDDGAGPATLLFHRGVVVRQRSQIRLNRVQSVDVNQPLVPRLFGLSKVRLDMAAGDDASVELAYLRHGDAWALRDEILRHTGAGAAARRAAAPAGSSWSPELEPGATAAESARWAGAGGALAWAGRAVESSQETQRGELIQQVSTVQLVKASLLDGIAGWAGLVIWIVAVIVLGSVYGLNGIVAGLSGIIPVTLAIVAQVRRQVGAILRDADFKLYRTPTGVRISSGLTSTINRTVDLDRIQEVRLVEPFLWRRYGWARVKMDIAGGSDEFEKGASLIPVADRSTALRLVAEVTGAQLDEATFVPPGQGARRLDPLGWRFLGVAATTQGAVSRAGRWTREVAFVPYARVQSVSVRQGFVQRGAGVATVYLDLPRGAKRWTAMHRGVADAARLVGELAEQARLHRLQPAAHPAHGRAQHEGQHQQPHSPPLGGERRPRDDGQPADEQGDDRQRW